ncbi:MAG: hypothetical protein CSB55_01940 [Candidatus Cloacimonadota bacterium]|nr:MAG: hypothetical protein CSB55_01940 [Candidatus Cloacimonadota bacterium]
MKKFIALIMIIAVAIFNFGCSRVKIAQKNYYVFEYNKNFENPELKQAEPFPASAVILDAELPRTYGKKQIVKRYSNYKISYYPNDLWANRLSSALPDLINARLQNYNIFGSTYRDVYNENPDYRISVLVDNIEVVTMEEYPVAHLALEFVLTGTEENKNIFSYKVDKQKMLYSEELELFVQAINDILMSETDIFAEKIISYLKTGKISGKEEQIAQKEKKYNLVKENILDKGRIFLPSKTDPDQEPMYDIYSENWKFIASAYMNEDVTLDPGKYNLKIGSGYESQKTEEQIEVFPRYKTVLKPEWAWLTVKLIDESRNSLNLRYEVFDLKTTESYGTGIGANEETGEKLQTWILPEGIYKIVLNNKDFNTYSDFTTVSLKNGELTELTIVIDSATDRLTGAGIFERDRSSILEYGKLSSAVHGNINFSSDNSQDENKHETSLLLNTQLDTKYTYDKFPYSFVSKNLMEFGTIKSRDTDWRVSGDSFSWKNTLVYYFSDLFGIYSRGDIKTHVFDQSIYDSNEKNFKIIENDGNVYYKKNTKKLKVKDAFYPLDFKEGVGFNFRMLNSSKRSLILRSGFGMRQNYTENELVYSGNIVEDGTEYQVYSEKKDEEASGIEISMVSNFQLPFDITLDSNADILIPFENGKSASWDWENILNIKLIKHVSIDYKLDLSYSDESNTENSNDYIVQNHSVFLRLSYFLY